MRRDRKKALDSESVCFAGLASTSLIGERGGLVVELRTLNREVGARNLPPPCCVLVQDTLLPESTGNTQEAVAPSRRDRKIVDWDV